MVRIKDLELGEFPLLLAPMEDVSAVSYTHLDVYKRQNQGLDLPGFLLNLLYVLTTYHYLAL